MQLDAKDVADKPAVWVVGDLYTTLASGEDTDGRYALIHAVVPPGSGPPPHVHHREDEAFFVLEGEVAFHADGQAVAGRAGKWVTLPRGSRHFFRNEGSTPATMLILVSPPGLEKFFAEVGRPAEDRLTPPPVTPSDIERLLTVAPRYGIDIEPHP